MPGDLHEISRAIGALEEASKRLTKSFDQHCCDDDRRHDENIAVMREIRQAISDLNQTVTPLAKTVTEMKPVVQAWQISRWKMAGAISLALMLVALLGWFAEQAIKGVIGLALGKMH